ncbi:S9 family peptidase [Frankia sp. CNm7]|uniref:S9 family peptidase n=1 Tax=Frankia nepalensis TaxID=1836974 RepID=A0A937RJV4_9ACTN|nr:prolyl oligopeptidase family serine peptidase [Frankia nepalensis]MBL7496460.1 S9 family peptidase [Frankia nepalensis]MBL7510803.1 S9 family peptidase [Frankia nepalensis]MBL7521700.1 S9 family peptidase [Frankia nepalensis]MBL7631602.1 S9 family peptidase [Frankia nepalensis]
MQDDLFPPSVPVQAGPVDAGLVGDEPARPMWGRAEAAGLRTAGAETARGAPPWTGPGDDPFVVPGVWAPSLGPGGSLAFVSDRDGAPAPWAWEPAGQAGRGWVQERVDAGPGFARAVSWSPDGAWLAVEVAPGGGELHEVRVVRRGRPGWRRLAGGPAGAASAVSAEAGSAEVATAGTEAVRTEASGTEASGAAGLAGRRAGTSAALGPWTPGGDRLVVCESLASGHTEALLVDPATGGRERVATGVALVVCDARARRDGAGYLLLVRTGSRGRRRLLLVDTAASTSVPVLAGEATVAAGRFGPGGTSLLVTTNAGRDRVALFRLPLAEPARAGDPIVPRTRQEPVPLVGRELVPLAGRDDADLEFCAVMPGKRSAVLGWNAAGRTELSLLDLDSGFASPLPAPPRPVATALLVVPSGEILLALAGPGVRGELWTLDPAAPDGYRLVVAASPRPGAVPPAPPRPGAVLPAQRATTEGAAAVLGAPAAVTFPGHGGLELSGWLHLPAGRTGPGPAFIYLHGGPESQERPGYQPLLAALAARGVAVLAPNVRGSTGYGQAFERADDLAGRFDAIADVAACHAFLVAAGVADPARVGVGGRSYGGYLTLAALVTYPELFGAGVDICGMADLETFYADTEPWIAASAVSKYGHPATDRALLRDLSPLHRTDALAAPLLVVHGANDTNVGVREAVQVVAAARARGVECRFLLFEGEGHELAVDANVARFVRETADWLAGRLVLADAPAAVEGASSGGEADIAGLRIG